MRHNLTLKDMNTSCPHLSFWGGSPRPDIPHVHAQFPISWAEGEALVHLGRWSGQWNARIKFLLGHFLTSFNQIFWAFILHLFWLSSVTDFSGISQCANQQEEGQQNWTSNDQGQLHMRSLELCSLSSAPLLITACVFPVEWKGASVGLENYTCVDLQSKCVIYGKSMVLNAKKILWWKLLSFVVLDLFSTTYLIIYYPH